MKDWIEWHLAYEDPAHHLTRRLEIVRRRLADALDATAAPRPRVLSLCAGDGRDVIPVLTDRGPPQPACALLVESNAALADRAMEAARRSGLADIEVRCGDAADPRVFQDFLPAHVLLLCGIFGNVEPSDVKAVIGSVRALIATGGYVIWTRGDSPPDMRPQIRDWLTAEGLVELSFDGAPEPFGVGVNQMAGSVGDVPAQLPARLFSFVA